MDPTGDRLATGAVTVRFWHGCLLHVTRGTFVEAASGATPHNGGATLDVATPGTAGNLLVIVAHKRFTGAFTTRPAGVTLRETVTGSGGVFEVYTAVQDSRSSYTWTAPAGSIMAAAIVAVDRGTYDTHSPPAAGDSTAAAIAPGLTPRASGLLIGMWGWLRGNTLTPEGMTQRAQRLATADNDLSQAGVAVATQVVTPDVNVALAAPTGRRELAFAFELLDKDNRPIGWLDDVHQPRVAYNALADIKATFQATIRDSGDVDWLSDRIRPWARLLLDDGSWHEWPLGVYLASTTVRAVRGRGTVMRPVDGYDQLQVLADHAGASRVTDAAGSNVIAAVRTALELSGITDHVITPSDEVWPTAREWPPGTSRLRRINDRLDAVGYEALWFDRRGRAVARPWRTAGERRPVWTYRDDDQSVALPEVDQELDLFGVANRWVLVVSEPDRPPMVAVRQNDRPGSETSTVRRGRVITDVREQTEATSQAALEALADRIAAEASQVFEAVEMTTAIMPVHWHASAVDLVWSELDVSARYSEHKWDMMLQAGAKMKHRIRRVVDVG